MKPLILVILFIEAVLKPNRPKLFIFEYYIIVS